MRILFCDLLFQQGNRHVDNVMLDVIAQDNEVFLLMNDDFILKDFPNKNRVTVLGNPFSVNPQRWKDYRLQVLRRMRYAAKMCTKYKPDLVYISTYKTTVFPIGLLFFSRKVKIVVVENNNIDLLEDRVNRFTYRLFANRVYHIVYEPYFKDYLINSLSVKPQNIFVIPHFQYVKECPDGYKSDNQYNNYDCIAISGSNDYSFIKEIVRLETKYNLLRRNNVRVRIKCKGIEYHTEYLEVNGGFIEDEEYDNLYKSCKVVLVPFPQSYKFRMSGCIVDAFSHHKPVVSSYIKLADYYNQVYGDIIRTVNSPMEMLYSAINLVLELESAKFDFSDFEQDHGEERIKQCLDRMLETIATKK